MDKDNKLPETGIETKSEFIKKLDNFWYYNKWKVIFGAFIIFVIAVCAIQCATREDYDVRVLYGGAFASSDQRVPAMQDALSTLDSDEKSDGVGLNVMEIYSADFVQKNPEKVNTSLNSQNYDTLCQLITAGDHSVLILDKWIYDEIKDRIGKRTVSEICGDGKVDAEDMYDEYAVYFKETDFYAAYASTFGGLSEDCVICLCIYSPYKATVGCAGSDGDSDYQASVDLFYDILTYGN